MTLIEKLSKPLGVLVKAINELETGKTFIKLADFGDEDLNYDSVINQAQRACQTAMYACLSLDVSQVDTTSLVVPDDYIKFCADNADKMTEDINIRAAALQPAIEKLLAMEVNKESNISTYSIDEMNESMATASDAIELVFNVLEHVTNTEIPRTSGAIDRFLETLE